MAVLPVKTSGHNMEVRSFDSASLFSFQKKLIRKNKLRKEDMGFEAVA